MDLPQAGRPVDEVLSDLVAKRAHDARWADGRTFGLVSDGGSSVHDVAERAAAAYLHENALNTHAFPSLASIQNEVVAWTAALLRAHKLPDVSALMTPLGFYADSIERAYLTAGSFVEITKLNCMARKPSRCASARQCSPIRLPTPAPRADGETMNAALAT